MSKDTTVKARECMSLVVIMLTLASFWNINSSSVIKNNSYKVYKVFVHFCIISYIIANTMRVIVDRDKFDEIIECIIVTIAMIVFIPKYYTVVVDTKAVQSLVSSIQENFFIHREHFTTENKSIIISTLKLAKIISILYICLLNSCFVLYAEIVPLVTYLTSLEQSTNTFDNITTSDFVRNLQINIWLPYDHSPTPAFQFTFSYLLITLHILGICIISIDILIVTLLIFISGQFELLCYALKSIEENVIHRIRRKLANGEAEDIDILSLERKIYKLLRIPKRSYLHDTTVSYLIGGRGNHIRFENEELTCRVHEYFQKEYDNARCGKENEDLMPHHVETSEVREDEDNPHEPEHLMPEDFHTYEQGNTLTSRSHIFQREAEHYLVECIQHHQTLIQWTKCTVRKLRERVLRTKFNCKSMYVHTERIPNLSAEQFDGITVFRISPMASLMLHRCRTGALSLERWWQRLFIAMTAIDSSSSFVAISLQRDVIVVHRSGEIRNTLTVQCILTVVGNPRPHSTCQNQSNIGISDWQNLGLCIRHEHTPDKPKLNIWCDLTRNRIIESFFFYEATVTGVAYHDMLKLIVCYQIVDLWSNVIFL
ncbi:hypothetical protein ANN_02450 [Periplaneta americana]|uniref:Uncharacterized protein n=1 Tax=Periplaneta americana TaxID=6978 RepID=A0ABQ8TWF3_PERAM|nr:hypothetical protein ANN_02450 [Periplaneta americana]